MTLTRRQLLHALLALAAAPLGGCGATGGELTRTLFHFDTVCVLGGVMDASVLDEAERLCQRYEDLLSRTRPDSDVSRINAAGGAPCQVDAETADLIARSLAYSEASDGLFDITIGCVSELWDFHESVVPDKDVLAAALGHVGWRNVSVAGNEVCLHDPLARIDLGGIAKGFVADRLCDLFRERGVEHAYVNLGGNVCVIGGKADGGPWSVGVRDPNDESGQRVVAKVSCTDGSVVTSGLYERMFELDGRRYWHILDPRTGYPVAGDVVSASILSQRSIDGDGHTKPLFMMTPDEGCAYLEERGLDGLLLGADGGRWRTSGSAFVDVE